MDLLLAKSCKINWKSMPLFLTRVTFLMRGKKRLSPDSLTLLPSVTEGHAVKYFERVTENT